MTSATATTTHTDPPAARRAGRSFLPEVQGIRAIAVLLVLAYHVRPGWVPGGYIGVDVFFVISGFLITTMLIREVDRTERFSLAGFYARRARRILPAATVVLIVTAVVGYLLLPVTRLEEMVRQIAASALYVENWYLAQSAVDYLAADNAPSPVQHYWSLAIEEQFYLLWPLLIIGWVALRRRWEPRRADAAMIGATLALTLASLAASIVVTATDPGPAYFVLHTRIWELSAGGVLAFALARWSLPAPLRWWLGWAGLALIGGAAFAFTAETPFPGAAALLPVLGALALIASGDSDAKVSVYRVLSSRPALYVGDISYSMYLWHWPLIIFAASLSGSDDLPWPWAAAVIAASFGLAHLTKIAVEDPVRRAKLLARAATPALVMGAACVALTVAVTAVQYTALSQQREAAAADVSPQTHPGALALAEGRPGATEVTAPIIPDLASAADDIPSVYDDGCHGDFPDTTPRHCVYGAQEDPAVTIALVGDSHGAQWVPALQQVVEARDDWQLVTYTKSSCAFTAAQVTREGSPYSECAQWNEAALGELTTQVRPDVVVVANSVNSNLADAPDDPQATADLQAEGMAEYWRALQEDGIPVVGLVDTPRLGNNTPDCVAENPEDPMECARPRADAFERPDPAARAAELAGAPAAAVDMSDVVCDDATCYPVVGNTLTYRDTHHITAAFARSAGPVLEQRLIQTVEGLDRSSPAPEAGD
ncbi:acyltransferase family protein [Allonocardiopsis opalescens]|uniref:Peptidoglycan/LPS O-acetylase OafA/YrhL n=1 Tax=Allonocardiopsis opalescens TaxID=1144618 RepID=A0A2T0PTN7_9ACTN|nr:acyltransferase family protein [Allonocardiopsis opalescens]PRX92261.1 peptidoglycan/LPS O-acetylase OafA/YrhL [Allonocardiopsis opalescens]